MNRSLLLVLGLICAVGAQAAIPPDLGRRVLADYIRPATADLESAARALSEALAPYCDEPGDERLRDTVEQRFAALAVAWSRVELLRFGPLVEDNRFERFFFFPDPRGVTLRQLQALLANAEPQRIEATALRTDSVALQGIPALEYALYGGDAAQQIETDAAPGRYRCAYAQAVSANLLGLAAELRAAWDSDAATARAFAAPGPSRALYRSPQEVATEVLKALSTGLQYARDSKLLPALGNDAETARASRAPLWRSGLTTRSLAASLDGVHTLYRASGFGQALDDEAHWIDANIASESATAIADLEAVSLPFDQAVADDDSRTRLVHAALVIKNLQSIVVEYLAPALGVNLGFNALDGD